MTDSAADDRAASAVGHLMASGRIPAAPGLPLPVGGRVVRGKYTFGQLAAWRDVTFQHITSLPRHEVASLDLDEKANTVTIGVTSLASKGDRDDLIANLVRLGIPERALRLQEDTRGNTVGRSALLVTAREAWSDVRQPPLEMIGGHQVYIVGHGNCTIGFVARRNGVAGFVTASHCTTNQFGADSNSVSYVEGAAVIAKELHDPDDYECGIHSGCRGSDAAFFGPTSATENPPMAVGLIAKPISYPLTQGGFVYSDQGYWIVVSEEANNGYVGMPVSKVGKTTGWTSGEIIATCADYWGSIEYVTTCTYRTTLVDDSGDSGAPVFLILNRGNEVMALGTLNNGRVSKLSRIKSDFAGEGATLSFTRSPTLPAPVVTSSTFSEDGETYPVLSWAPVPGGTYYNVFRQVCTVSCGAWTRLYSTDQTEMMDGAANIAQPDPYVVYYRVAAMSPTAVGSQSALQAFY